MWLKSLSMPWLRSLSIWLKSLSITCPPCPPLAMQRLLGTKASHARTKWV